MTEKLRKTFKSKALIYTTPSGWINEELFIKWFEKVWFKQEFATTNPVIIFDRCPIHTKKTVLEYFKEKKQDYFLIPPGCTGYLQPLDVTINKPFKDRIRKYFQEWVNEDSLNPANITNKGNIRYPDNSHIVEWIVAAFESINGDMISKSFKTCGISITLII